MLLLALLPLSNLHVMAQSIDFGVGYEDPHNPFGDDPRSPILIPEVDIDGYTLIFYTPCDGCVLRLINENDVVVYSTVIPTGANSLVLPSYLSGNYEIQIVRGIFYFGGYINL